jgi:L-asparaginase II
VDVLVTRGALVEARHRVHAAVVGADGALLASARDPWSRVWWRSCAKPFQVMPLLRSGGLDAAGWGLEELALACASHGGEPEHVALASRMLSSLGLSADDLACGPHEPLAARGARIGREHGTRWTRLHNNCSGKHSAMLARALQHQVPTRGYHEAAHRVQQECLDAVSAWAALPTEAIEVSADGCGVSVFALPLAHMAWAYARLAWAARQGDAAGARVVEAMTSRPFLVGGTDRFDTVLMEATGGNVLCKIGAEGVHTFVLVDRAIGFALKVEDGAARAQYPAVLALLAAFGGLPDPLPEALALFGQRSVTNTRGEVVGRIAVGAGTVGHVPQWDGV